jgi:glycosyltransferase involved in cell wall biosynthesis
MPGGRADQPLVSVGVPVFNEEEHLPGVLEAILAQDYERLEVIICDNASTDSSVEVAKAFAARDDRVAVHTSDENRGASDNFNRCFRLASGEYFTWASGHDTRLPAAIRMCVEALEADRSLVLCYPRSLWRRFDGRAEPVVDDTLETQGLSAAERLRTTVEQFYNGNAVYGVIRSSALAQTRLSRRSFGADLVLLAELSVLGGFHQLEDTLFVRTENRLPEPDDGWRDRSLDLIGVDRGLARSRPYTTMGFETVAGVWHVSNPAAKLLNAARVGEWFRERWHADLSAESRVWRAIDTVALETRPVRTGVMRRVRRLLT